MRFSGPGSTTISGTRGSSAQVQRQRRDDQAPDPHKDQREHGQQNHQLHESTHRVGEAELVVSVVHGIGRECPPELLAHLDHRDGIGQNDDRQSQACVHATVNPAPDVVIRATRVSYGIREDHHRECDRGQYQHAAPSSLEAGLLHVQLLGYEGERHKERNRRNRGREKQERRQTHLTGRAIGVHAIDPVVDIVVKGQQRGQQFVPPELVCRRYFRVVFYNIFVIMSTSEPAITPISYLLY